MSELWVTEESARKANATNQWIAKALVGGVIGVILVLLVVFAWFCSRSLELAQQQTRINDLERHKAQQEKELMEQRAYSAKLAQQQEEKKQERETRIVVVPPPPPTPSPQIVQIPEYEPVLPGTKVEPLTPDLFSRKSYAFFGNWTSRGLGGSRDFQLRADGGWTYRFYSQHWSGTWEEKNGLLSFHGEGRSPLPTNQCRWSVSKGRLELRFEHEDGLPHRGGNYFPLTWNKQ